MQGHCQKHALRSLGSSCFENESDTNGQTQCRLSKTLHISQNCKNFFQFPIFQRSQMSLFSYELRRCAKFRFLGFIVKQKLILRLKILVKISFQLIWVKNLRSRSNFESN